MGDLILRTALGGKQPDGVPVWLMRQAGRYLPEFREVRVENEFFKVCEDPVLAAEVTVQPRRRYADLDACILFSDILVVPRALGMECDMIPGKGPTFRWSLAEGRDDFCWTAEGCASTVEKIDRLFAAVPCEHVSRAAYTLSPSGEASAASKSLLEQPEVEVALRAFVKEHLGYVSRAVEATVGCLKTDASLHGECPLIGFTGAPLTLLGYMVEGGGSKTWAATRALLYALPAEAGALLGLLTDLCAVYVDEQLAAGARLAQVFETNGGEFPPSVYARFGMPAMLHIAKYLRPRHPGKALMAFPKDVADVRVLNSSDYDVVGLSWRADVSAMRSQLPDKVLQGNLDPALLFAGEKAIRAGVRQVVAELGPHRGLIFNLGHGMMPQMSPEAVAWLLDELKRGE